MNADTLGRMRPLPGDFDEQEALNYPIQGSDPETVLDKPFKRKRTPRKPKSEALTWEQIKGWDMHFCANGHGARACVNVAGRWVCITRCFGHKVQTTSLPQRKGDGLGVKCYCRTNAFVNAGVDRCAHMGDNAVIALRAGVDASDTEIMSRLESMYAHLTGEVHLLVFPVTDKKWQHEVEWLVRVAK